MAFGQNTRIRLQRFVADARSLLTDEFTRQLQATYGMNPETGEVADIRSLPPGLTPSQRETAHLLRDTLAHYLANAEKGKEKARKAAAIERIVREQAFTVLNRLAAIRMSEARGFLTESLAKGYNSKGFEAFIFYTAGSSLGEKGDAYRHYLFSLFDEFSLDLSVLFDRFSVQGRLFPSTDVLPDLLKLINAEDIAPFWAEDETIGWIYQYFNSIEERKKMRAESQAPRNSRELAVRNQFFTPRYVVEFLTDNTLGRIWYEMTQGATELKQICKYLVRRPNEFFLEQRETAPEQEENLDLSQEELLQQAVYIEHRALKDPRDIRMLDPACGSMHFGLYAFDLFEAIYSEAWDIETAQGTETFIRENGRTPITSEYKDKAALLIDVPRLIIENNIHGVDIDPRATQIAGLSLWLRAHNSWQQAGIKPQNRPKIQRSNIVCAEPMPGEKTLLEEFTASLKPTVLGQLVVIIFEKMELAGEAGTLLKIEQEIQDAIAEAKQLWQKQNQALPQFPDLAQIAKQLGEIAFDVSDIDDEKFWEQAEQKILDALADYAQGAATDEGGQKRLFTEDASKGFAFIELCRKRFDVVLMNPPFGRRSEKCKNYYDLEYSSFKPDIGLAFVDYCSDILCPGGKLGALTSRTFLSGNTFNSWRENKLFSLKPLQFVADLGIGVLDDAMVETAAYTIQNTSSDNAIFIRALETKAKEEFLRQTIHSLNVGKKSTKAFIVRLKKLSQFPLAIAAYWIPENLLGVINHKGTLLDFNAATKHGLQTTDDFQFMRLSWEVNNNQLSGNGFRWPTLAKGGEYSPFIDNLHLCVDWKNEGERLKAYLAAKRLKTQGSEDWTPWMNSHEYYFTEGLTFPARTASDFSPRILPKGCVFTASGQALIFKKNEHGLSYLAAAFTRAFKIIVEAFVGSGDNSVSGSAANTYRTGLINALPVPVDLNDSVTTKKGAELVQLAKVYQKQDETSRYFCPFMQREGDLLANMTSTVDNILDYSCKALEIIKEIDKQSLEQFGLTEESAYELFGRFPANYPKRSLSKEEVKLISSSDDDILQSAISIHGTKRQFIKKAYFFNRRLEQLSHALECHPETIRNYVSEQKIQSNFYPKYHEDIISWVFGVQMGRWDIKSFSDNESENIWSALGGFKVSNTTSLGIVELDFNNPSSFISGIRTAIGELFDNIEIFEDQLFEILTSKNYADYFSKPNKYFSTHYSKYSESRRNAPIYWPLQTQSGSYTLWLYYHRLNEQTLYTCVNDFVEPKLQSISVDLTTLKNKPFRSLDEEKEFDRLTDFKAEIVDFRDELFRIAKFWKPNLNDGVQITAAPLWRLFQHKAWQKKLKETWKNLEEGEYDWAHLAYSIWPARVLGKCHKDRSLAIAHDVEDELWHEVKVIKGRKKEPVWEWQLKPLSDTELNMYIQNKIQA